jgi:hypothetical protein
MRGRSLVYRLGLTVEGADMEKTHTSPDLLEQIVALVREHGPLTEREIALRLGADPHRVEVTVDQATELLR